MAKQRILVADNEPDLLRAIALRLKFAGYDVVVAKDGAAALELMDIERPDLALVDIRMPNMDGHCLAQRMQENETMKSMPVIFMTGKTGEKDRLQAFAEGAAGFLTKPVESQELLDMLAKTLAATRHADCVFNHTHQIEN
jgi:two-component system OmpR family response regulator